MLNKEDPKKDSSFFEPNKSFYDRIAAVYDALAHASEVEACEKGIELLNPTVGEDVLEIGFGTGHALLSLAKHVGNQGTVLGFDVSVQMKNIATKRVQAAGLSNRIKLELAGVPPIPKPDESVDCVFLCFTLELFPADIMSEVVSECYRILRPGGRCAVVSMATPKTEAEDTLIEKSYCWMHHHFPHIVDCRPIDAEAALKAGAFTISSNARTEIWTLPVAIVVGLKASDK